MGGIPKESVERLLFLRREMDRLFRDFFQSGSGSDALAEVAADVLVDVFETPEEIVIEAELPGLRREDLELSVLRDILIIEGHKPRPQPPADSRYLCMERAYGAFRRVVELPSAGDMQNLKARFEAGVLTVRLPRIRERRGQKRKVAIE